MFSGPNLLGNVQSNVYKGWREEKMALLLPQSSGRYFFSGALGAHKRHAGSVFHLVP